ncbi:MAG: Threonylcarbamoyl-AMP synthase [archaeon ADurb.Bin336]|nr:MAG: Threonylcarbamoyl-AMP synthase [archaeon ADurb.Bin336]
METKLIKINLTNKNKVLSIASDLIKKGEVVAFPTETVYGLGANALDENAVKKIFIAKGRPNDNPLIVHISDIKQLNELVEFVPKEAEILIKKYWPGPLTIVMKKSKRVPSCITGGLNTVAIRMPNNTIALGLIKKAGVPIAAPSANSSTKPSPTLANHVLNDLNGKIPLIIDGGKCKVGLESTVLGLSNGKAVLYRPGKITKEELEKIIGEVELPSGQIKVPSSPGMKYKHYSPKAEVILIEAKIDANESKDNFLGNVKKIGLNEDSNLIGVISFTKKIGFKNEFFFNNDVNLYAKNLFFALREFDKRGVEKIIVEGILDEGFGLAVMNRLRKAASKII